MKASTIQGSRSLTKPEIAHTVYKINSVVKSRWLPYFQEIRTTCRKFYSL